MADRKNMRDVYIISHRTNSIDEIEEALRLGANGLECDVRGTTVQHDPHLNPTKLIAWLKAAAVAYERFPGFGMIYFDVKAPEDLRYISWCVRDYLPEDLCSLYAVADIEDRNYLDVVIPTLRDTEGITIDGHANQAEIAAFLTERGDPNAWFSYGIPSRDEDDTLRDVAPSIEEAIALRTPEGGRKVCVWTLKRRGNMVEYLNRGVDALLVERDAVAECVAAVGAMAHLTLAPRCQAFHGTTG